MAPSFPRLLQGVLLCALLVLLLPSSLVSGQPPDSQVCPVAGGGSNTVTCSSFAARDQNCFARCCMVTGECMSSSCVSTFGSPNSADTNCAGSCLDEVECIPVVPSCLEDAEAKHPHCRGTVRCKPGTLCDSHHTGDICLYDGVSKNFKVCTPVTVPPSTTGPGAPPSTTGPGAPPSTSTSTGPSMFIVGDPQFVGLRGQSYQVHGVSGEVYNIISDRDLQYNSRFVFLDTGACPVVNGKKQKGCFSHPGSYLGELGLKTSAGDRIHVVSGDAQKGFDEVSVNGKALEIGDKVLLSGDLGSVTCNTTHLISVQVGHWDFAFENSDRFINQRVQVLNVERVRAHGLLGQTWRTTTYPNSVKYIQGQVDDYVILDNDVFGDNFVFNNFN